MLEAVVEQVELRSKFLLGEDAGSVAGFSDNDRNVQTPGHQQRFIAEIMRRTGGVHHGHAAGRASITTREDIEFQPARFQQFAQEQDKRRLAGSTDGEVSDAHHRAAEPLGTREATVIERIARANPKTEE